jgi:histidine triad (HIT) family protein
MSETTLFERILTGETPAFFIAKGEGWASFLDVFPRREGHTLVIPTTPATHLQELSDLESNQLMIGVKETQKILSEYFSTEDFTVLLHDGPLAGQEIPHVHFHVLPREAGDGGKGLMSLWPNTKNTAGGPDFEVLSKLHTQIIGG